MIWWFIFSTLSWANVFPPDDRVSFHEVSDPAIRALSEGSVALVRKSHLSRLPDGRYQLNGDPLTRWFRMCPDALFAQEPLIANCSGALVAKDVILTAGHCVTKTGEGSTGIHDQVAVFNYRRHTAEQTSYIIEAEDVHELKEFIYHEFVGARDVDLTLIRLERASQRKPLTYRRTSTLAVGTPLFILGYPLGTPLKLVDGSEILSYNHPEKAFRHELDTFSVNSGSPVFNALTHEIIGVHARGTGMNTQRYGRSCDEWRLGDPNKDWEEANYLTPLPMDQKDL